MKFNSKNVFGFVGIIISIILIVFLFRRFDFDAISILIANVNILYILLLGFIYLSTFPLQALRWKLMLANYPGISLRIIFNSIVLSYVGNNIIPARGGELLRMESASRKLSIPRLTLLSSILMEKILDGITLIFILSVCSFSIDKSLQSAWVSDFITALDCIFLLAISFLIVMRFFGKNILLSITSNSRLALGIRNIGSEIFLAIEFIGLDLKSFYILLLSGSIWFLEGLMFVVAIKAFDIEVNSFLVGFFALCIVNFGTIVPSSPGFIGVIQGLTLVALSVFNVSENNALAVGLLINFVQYVTVMFLGVFILKDFIKFKQVK